MVLPSWGHVASRTSAHPPSCSSRECRELGRDPSQSRLLRLWDKPVEEVVQLLSPTLCNLTHYNPPGSSVHVILQARILEWVAFPFSSGFSRPSYWIQWSNLGLQHYRQILYHLSHQGSPRILECVAYPFSRGTSQPRN